MSMNRTLTSIVTLLTIIHQTCSFINHAKNAFKTVSVTTKTSTFSSTETEKTTITWQENLDSFLDPFTSPDKKQVLLSDLINANEEIRDSLQSAIQERNIDPLLTPRAKQFQEGTRTVANQIKTDIIPQISKSVSNPSSSSSTRKKLVSPEEIPNITNRIITQTSTQVQKSFEQLTQDISDPSRIPERISKQSQDILQEVSNIFRDTPEGLKGPDYTVITKKDNYEIRDYEAYIAASTSMLDDEDTTYSFDDAFNSGNGFNTLASYLFGKNKEEKALSMTTPVSITNNGEMGFYLYNDDEFTPSTSTEDFPSPLETEEKEVNVKEVSSCTLAVARFTGFVTDGEVSRQKEALLNEIKADGLEIDALDDSSSIPHIILQYNPPYTLPVIRRNEIAIPIKMASSLMDNDVDDDYFLVDDDDDDVSPSD